MTRADLAALAARGPVLLDGATGSCLRAAGMPPGIAPELWILEHPQTLLSLQRAYVAAGSQILFAPTFSANRLALSGFGQAERVGELNRRLAALSREAAGGRALVAADLSTLGRPLGEDLSYAQAYEIYREQIQALSEAGVDLVAAETLMGAEEALAALDAAASVCALPVLCSFSTEADGSLLFGGDVREAAAALEELGAAAVGVNCSVGPDQLECVVAGLRAAVDLPVIAKPNAGLPEMDEAGQAHYAMGPEEFVRGMLRLRAAGASLLGGCCGTTPDYIRALASRL